MCILLVICIISAPGCLLIGHDLPDQRSARAIEHHKSALFSFPRLFLIPSHDVLWELRRYENGQPVQLTIALVLQYFSGQIYPSYQHETWARKSGAKDSSVLFPQWRHQRSISCALRRQLPRRCRPTEGPIARSYLHAAAKDHLLPPRDQVDSR